MVAKNASVSRKLGSIFRAAKRNGGAFSREDAGADYGVLNRLISYGLAEKTDKGKFKLADGIKHLKNAYAEAIDKIINTKKRGVVRSPVYSARKRRMEANAVMPAAVNKPMPTAVPTVRIMQYTDDGQVIIIVGKRLFLAKEVGLSEVRRG